MSETDEVVYNRFLTAGSEEDFRILLERHRQSLMLFIYGIIGSLEDAEELMIDAFAVAASGTARFSGKSSFKTWLFAIGRNLALKAVRKNKYNGDELSENHSSEREGPEEELLKKERDIHLYKALEQINPDYREILFLVYMEEMSIEEAAKVLKKNKKQVYNLLARGRQALKEKLTEMGFDDEGY